MVQCYQCKFIINQSRLRWFPLDPAKKKRLGQTRGFRDSGVHPDVMKEASDFFLIHIAVKDQRRDKLSVLSYYTTATLLPELVIVSFKDDTIQSLLVLTDAVGHIYYL